MDDKTIPVINISYAASLYNKDLKTGIDTNIQTLAKEIFAAFTKFGFVYIKGHGISSETVSNIIQLSYNYFNLSSEEKNKNLYKNRKVNFCYIPSQCEQFSHSTAFDMKEAFDFIPTKDETVQGELPLVFDKSLEAFFWDCFKLTSLILALLNIAYGVSPPDYFTHVHQHIGNIEKNISTLRTLYYPAINHDKQFDRVRCSEHTDYGTLTLLFQDETGGLEVSFCLAGLIIRGRKLYKSISRSLLHSSYCYFKPWLSIFQRLLS